MRFAGQPRRAALAMLVMLLAVPRSHANEISVTQWGATMNGASFAVAMEKKLFEKAGIEITGILGSTGGGTTVRNVLSAGLPYGEVSLAAAIAAINQGIDIKLVNGGVRSLADYAWVVMPDSPLKSPTDIKGKRLSISRPKSVTDMFSIMIIEKLGLRPGDAERPALGTFSAGLAALESGDVDAAFIAEPGITRSRGKYRVLFRVADILPPMMQNVGSSTPEFIKREPHKLRAIIAGRRAGVDAIYADPKEAAAILAKAYGLEAKVAKEAIDSSVAARLWSHGEFDLTTMNEMVRGLRIIGEVKGDIDWEKLIDRSLLPDDLRQ